ncbi:hypothetical protein KP509_22G067900 [Ceratopteris richardii]|uniref:Ubiquitin-like-conjugating enzyme ATG10 n=1 Tax=Ceratopteris richardii TaxID=49495 RepID=A0A8T2S9A1_CERRI|nr:hypothetical protein KP509_22G067900 [Ceratopteris richardii]
MDGTLSREDFRSSCCLLANLWRSSCPNIPQWRWHESVSCSFTGEGYLVLEDWPIEAPFQVERTQPSAYDVSCQGAVDEDEDIATFCCAEYEVHFYTYHIIYNDMYKVPKLLLKGRYSDGQPIELKDILQLLPAGLSNDIAKWTFLTYEEHPYMHMPWLALHPCGTSELMKMVYCGSLIGCQDGYDSSTPVTQFYILSWLSFVSQIIALKLPREFSQFFEPIKKTCAHKI